MKIYGGDNLESPRMKIHGGEITEMPIDVRSMVVIILKAQGWKHGGEITEMPIDS